jgi:N utilization substance protein B
MKPAASVSDLKRKAREVVAKTLYEVEMGGLHRDEALRRVQRKCRHADIRVFALRLMEETLDHLDGLDRIIVQVAENWHIDRMAAFDRNLLRMGAAEILLFDDVPDKVTINEAIEIAKRFSTENSGRFVNGILDRVAKTKDDLRGNLRHSR